MTRKLTFFINFIFFFTWLFAWNKTLWLWGGSTFCLISRHHQPTTLLCVVPLQTVGVALSQRKPEPVDEESRNDDRGECLPDERVHCGCCHHLGVCPRHCLHNFKFPLVSFRTTKKDVYNDLYNFLLGHVHVPAHVVTGPNYIFHVTILPHKQKNYISYKDYWNIKCFQN